MKQQATQLEIDFGPEFRVAHHPVPAAAKPVQTSVVDHAELRAAATIARSAAHITKAVASVVFSEIGFAVLSVVGCFALMFFAALLQG